MPGPGGSTCDDTTPDQCVEAGYVCDAAAFVSEGTPVCRGDADGNGVVNAADRGFISANIGASQRDLVCRYDVDGNGVVNAVDRGFVSAEIGLCTPLPDFQDGSGLNNGQPDTRFAPTFLTGQTCLTAICP